MSKIWNHNSINNHFVELVHLVNVTNVCKLKIKSLIDDQNPRMVQETAG